MIYYILVLGFFVWCFYTFYWKCKNLPPGPIPLPFVGNLFHFYKYGFGNIPIYLKTKYGDLNTVSVGSKPIISFNSFEFIQKAFVKNADVFSGRPKSKEISKLLRGGSYGITMTDGPLWEEHRKFAVNVWKQLGMGKNLMQERILTQVTGMIQELKGKIENGETEICIQKDIDVAVGSIINLLLFGYAFHEQNLEDFFKIKSFIRDFVKMSGNPIFRLLSSNGASGFLKNLPGFKTVYNNGKKLAFELKTFFDGQINEKRQKIKFDEDSEPMDYVEAYLRQQKKMVKSEREDENLYSNEQLFGCVFDIWFAGQETTSNTLAWMILYLMTNPPIQKKLHLELDNVIASDRLITTNDKINLPYVNAIVAETQRFCNLVPMNVPHRLTQNIEFHGYHLKADTTVIPQISSVLYDENIFPEPLKFKPTRFIDTNGKFQSKPELIPFSVGKRACLGEGLAKLELFLFASNLFNHFEITVIPSKPPNMDPIIGGTKISRPFVAHIKSRF